MTRHQPIRTLNGVVPKVGSSTFVSPSAQLIGNVEVGKSSSVGFGATVRGDVNEIKIGSSVHIGDLVTIHVTREGVRSLGAPTYIGDGAVVGLYFLKLQLNRKAHKVSFMAQCWKIKHLLERDALFLMELLLVLKLKWLLDRWFCLEPELVLNRYIVINVLLTVSSTGQDRQLSL